MPDDFILDYDVLYRIAKISNSIGSQADEYANSLSSRVANAISSITGPSSGYLEDAHNSVTEKIGLLQKKAADFYGFSNQISSLVETADQVDEEVERLFADNQEILLQHHKSLQVNWWKADLLNWMINNKNVESLLSILGRILNESKLTPMTNQNTLKNWYISEAEKTKSTFTGSDMGSILSILGNKSASLLLNIIGNLIYLNGKDATMRSNFENDFIKAESYFTDSIKMGIQDFTSFLNSKEGKDFLEKVRIIEYEEELQAEIDKLMTKNDELDVIVYNWEELKKIFKKDVVDVSKADYEAILYMYNSIHSKVGTYEGVDWESLEEFIESGYVNDKLVASIPYGGYHGIIESDRSDVFMNFMQYYQGQVGDISIEDLNILNEFPQDQTIQNEIRAKMFNLFLLNTLEGDEYARIQFQWKNPYDPYSKNYLEDLQYWEEYGARDKSIIEFSSMENSNSPYDIEINISEKLDVCPISTHIIYWDYQSGENAQINQMSNITDYIRSQKKDVWTFSGGFAIEQSTGEIIDTVTKAAKIPVVSLLTNLLIDSAKQVEINQEIDQLLGDYELTQFLDSMGISAQLTMFNGKRTVNYMNCDINNVTNRLNIYVSKYNDFYKSIDNFQPIIKITDVEIDDFIKWYYFGFENNGNSIGKKAIATMNN